MASLTYENFLEREAPPTTQLLAAARASRSPARKESRGFIGCFEVLVLGGGGFGGFQGFFGGFEVF